MTYQTHIAQLTNLIADQNGTWDAISPESVARMRLQNRFTTGLDIARYTAAIMRKDMAAYDADPAHYTQSLGCWHGFIAAVAISPVSINCLKRRRSRRAWIAGSR